MEDYTSRFLELRRFAPHQDERYMAMRYILGLSYHIRIHVVSLCCEIVDQDIVVAISVKIERELFKMEHQRDSSKEKLPMMSRSRSTLASQTGSTFGPSFGKRLVNWVTGGFSRDRSRSQTPQQHHPPQQQQVQQPAPI